MCKIQIPTVAKTATDDERRKAFFDAMYSANLSGEIEKKNNLSYLSWSQAWKIMKQFYPSATYKIFTNPQTGAPFWNDEKMGLMVHTSVTADDLEYDNWLPVMDYNNRSMKTESYAVSVWDKSQKRYVEKTVAAATTFEINASIQRSLVKCMAMHGLGLCLYMGVEAGEDLSTETQAPAQPDKYAGIKKQISGATDVTSLMSLYLDHQNEVEGNQEIKELLTKRKIELQKAA